MVALAPKMNRTGIRLAAPPTGERARPAMVLDRLALALFLILIFLSPLLYDLVQRTGS